MQCFGGLFSFRVVHDNGSSIAGAPYSASSTSGEASAAKCSPAACAQPAQQHCTETPQQLPKVTSRPAELPSAPQCVPSSPFCNGSTVADQQAKALQPVLVPAATASSADGVTAAHQIADESSITTRPRRPSALAEPVIVPLLTAAQKSKGKSALATEAFTALGCSMAPSASSFASIASQAGLKPATLPNNEMSGQNSQQGGGAQPQRSGSLSKQASLERKDLCPGLMASGASFSWDYIQPKAGGKDFLGQRKKDVRSSLDWDFQNNVAVAVTRRSKEYGEERPRITTAGLSAGRSYSGSISDSNSLV